MIFESEKSVLQCASYGYNNAVALGSNNLSEHQAKLILQLNPEHIIFMLDNNINFILDGCIKCGKPATKININW